MIQVAQRVQKREKFYFTFGEGTQVHYGGYIIIEAENIKEAQEKFIQRYGIRAWCSPHVLNYAFDYTEEEFMRTGMQRLKCHEVIR